MRFQVMSCLPRALTHVVLNRVSVVRAIYFESISTNDSLSQPWHRYRISRVVHIPFHVGETVRRTETDATQV
jgi:hypothetical protein